MAANKSLNGDVAGDAHLRSIRYFMRIIGPDLDRERDCEAILRSLPQWFGIEESIQMYVRDSKSLPGFGVETGPKLSGFISLMQHFPKAWRFIALQC